MFSSTHNVNKVASVLMICLVLADMSSWWYEQREQSDGYYFKRKKQTNSETLASLVNIKQWYTIALWT